MGSAEKCDTNRVFLDLTISRIIMCSYYRLNRVSISYFHRGYLFDDKTAHAVGDEESFRLEILRKFITLVDEHLHDLHNVAKDR